MEQEGKHHYPIDCPTVLLPDQPTDIDDFGSHERIADAITNLLEEPQCKSIALTGSWGSGKSSIVKLLEVNLSKSNAEHEIFIFDAWAHQGDPLRRSFLEGLINNFIKAGWSTEQEWSDVLDELKRRKEVTESRKTPILTFWGRLIGLTAIFIPIFYILFNNIHNQLLNKLAAEDQTSHIIVYILIPLVVAFLFTISPFIIALIASIKTGENSASLFIQKTEEVNKSITFRTPEPTSLEFNDLFTRILDKTLIGENRKLLIVIDNLDRIDPNEALSIWSTMRTFFELQTDHDEKLLGRFQLLVPFDLSVLKRLWYTEQKNNRDLANAFIDKTFQIKFHVAPPVLSDWKDFLHNQLSVAFPKHHNTEDFDKIFSIYRIHRSIRNLIPPTPREIKLFVNQIGVHHRIWGDYVPLYFQALYVLHKTDIYKNHNSFIKTDLIDQRLLNIVDKDFLRWLAVLHFNVKPPEKALQILIGKEVDNALREANKEQLSKLGEIPGSLLVCDNTIEENIDEWIKSEPETIVSAAYALEGFSPELDLSKTREKLQTAVLRVNRWKRLDERVINGFKAILSSAQGSSFENLAGHILETLTNFSFNDLALTKESKEENASLKSKKAREWLTCAKAVLLIIHKANYDELVKEKFCVPEDSQIYIDVISLLNEDGESFEFLQYFKPKSNPQDVIDELAAISEDPGFSELHANCIDIMTRIDVEWPWTNLIRALKTNLEDAGNLNPIEIRACVQSLSILAYKIDLAEAKEVLKQVSENGQLFHILNHVISKKDYAAAAACILQIMEFNPEASVSAEVGNSTAGVSKFLEICKDPNSNQKIIDGLYDLVRSLNRTQDLINQGADESSIKPLVRSILEQITLSEDVDQYITPDMIIDDFDTLHDLLDQEPLSNLIKNSISKANLLTKLTNKDFDENLAGLYLISYQETEEQNREIYLNFLIAGLRSIDTQTWTSELSDSGYLWELLETLMKDGISLNLNDKFHNAILNNVEKLCEDEFELNSSLLLKALDSASQETFMRNLRDRVLGLAIADGDVVPYIDFWGDELITEGFLEAKAKADDVCRHLLIRFLSSNDINKIKWVNKALAINKELLDNAEDASIDELRNKTKELLGDSAIEDSIKEELMQIAENIGVDIAQIQHDSSKEEEERSEEEEEKAEENGEESDSETESEN